MKYSMIYAFLPLGASLSNAFLGFYVFFRNPKNKINRWFGVLMFTLFVWQVGEFVIRSADNVEMAIMGMSVFGVGAAFLPSVFLYFTLLFPEEKVAYTRKKIFFVVLFLPAFVFILLHLLRPTILVAEMIPVFWGYEFRGGRGFPLFLSYFVLYCGIAEVNLLNLYLTARNDMLKKQSGFLLFGTGIVFLIGSLTDVIAPLAGLQILPMASVLTVFSDLCITYAILKYRLMIVYPVSEKTEETSPKYTLEKGKAYLLEEKKTERAFEIFVDLVKHGAYGLCITRNFPPTMRKKYELEKTPFLWLSSVGTSESIDPQDLGKMKHILTEFVSSSPDPVILLEGMEYLLVQVGFERLIKAIHAYVEIAVSKNGRFLVSLNPESFSDWEMSLLRKEMEEMS